MPFLNFITDEKLEKIISTMLTKIASSLASKENSFNKNVIDPFSIIFEMSCFKISFQQWKENEKLRQAQKSLSNCIGDFHQKILGSFDGWTNLPTGKIIDVVCHDKKIIAEIKNKHNTLKASNRSTLYHSLHDLVMKKESHYKDYTAYYVEVIPTKFQRYNKPFTPSDSSTGSKCSSNEKIRLIDGYSFYALASGVENALAQIFNALPLVIKKLNPEFNIENVNHIISYFKSAFGA